MEFTVVQVEKPTHVTRKLTIQVPAKEVARHFERGLQEVGKTAKLKGFRPGNIPLSVLKQYYGEDVRHQVFHNLIDESYRQAIRSEKIMAVGRPQIETPEHQHGQGAHDHGVREDQDLKFTATVEIMPEIEPKGYTGLPLTESQAEVTDKDVDLVLEGLRNSQAELIPATSGLAGADGQETSRPVRKGDHVDLVFSGGLVTDQGVEPHAGMKGSRMLEVGSDSLIPGFEDNLVDMRKGDSKTFRITFPADYHSADVAGKEAEFSVTINEVKEKRLPELSDEFAKSMGYEGLGDMRAKATEHLTSERKEESQRKLRSDLLQALIDKNSFDVPEALVQAQTRALAQEVAGNLKNQGFNEQMIQEALGGELANLKKRAENQVRASLILEAIAKKENITVTSDDVSGELKQMAVSMKVDEDKVRDFYDKNPNRKEDLEFRIREDRTVRFLLEKAKIKRS